MRKGLNDVDDDKMAEPSALQRTDRTRPTKDASSRHDIGVGIAAGLAVVGLTSAVWTAPYVHPIQAGSAIARSTGLDSPSGSDSASGAITVRVRLSGGLQRTIGRAEVQVTLPAGSDVASLGARLSTEYPGVGPYPMLITAGSNLMQPEMVSPLQILADGDLVEVIPPMSGG